MSGADGGNAPSSLTPAVLSSLTSQPATAEWLLSHAQHHILYHQQQLLYWTSLHNELGAVRKAQHAAASMSPAASPASSPTNAAPLSSPTAGGKNLFMHDLAARLGAGPPGRSRANSATAGVEESEQHSPPEFDRSPSALTHARRPGSKKNVKSTHAASFKLQGGLNRASSNESDPGASTEDVGKGEESKDEEKSVAVPIPVAMPVHEADKDSSAPSSSHASSATFASSSVSYVPVIQPSKGQVPPPVPRSQSVTPSPVSSTPPSPSSAAMAAAIRRPPPVPPGVKSGSSSVTSSQPSSPIIKSKPPIPPPVPAHELAAATSMAPPPVPASIPSNPASAVPAFQPRSLPQAPQRGGSGSNRGTPTTSPNSTATSANLPPPVPELPVTTSNEDYLASATPLANAPPSADGAPAEANAPAAAPTVGNRMGGMGGFKLPGAGGADNSDLMSKLAKKREAADAAPIALPAATVTTTAATTSSSSTASDHSSVLSTPVTTRTSANTSPIALKPVVPSSTAPSAELLPAMPPCAKCGCTDFKQNAFQKGKCNNCFHPH